MPILNTINTDTTYYHYRPHVLVYYYATFLRLRRECHIQNLFEQSFDLDQSLPTSDAI
jgi:hypothetical protein